MEEILRMVGIELPSGTSAASWTSEAEKLNSVQGAGDCPLCKGKGYIAYMRDGHMVTKDCQCEIQRRSELAIRKSGLAGLLESNTFASYQTPEPWQASVKEAAEQYLEDPHSGWFFVSGTPGTGKTHICTAICGELLKLGKGVRYMLWRRDAPRLKAEVNDRAAYERDLGKFRDCQVLYIDDFFKGSVSDADINLAFELLNDRYNSKRMTILSSERSVEDILELDEAIGSRIYERSKGFYARLPAKNWRLR